MGALRALGLGGAAIVALALGWLCFVWPPPSWYRTHWPSETAFMRMRERQAGAVHDATPRRYVAVPVDSMSQWLGTAATAAEDDAFYLHRGVDWRQLGRVLGYRRSSFAWSDPRDRAELRRTLNNSWTKRDKLRGASTITQQLAKNLYLSPSRNPLRKLKEAVIAYRLEWVLPKERILALYLNVAEFGRNLWGVEAASRAYFGRGAAQLSLDQAALLIATLPHPLTSNPAHRPERTRWRQQLILRKLRGEPTEVPVEEGSDSVLPPPPPLPPLPIVPIDTAAARETLKLRGDSIPAVAPVPADSAPKQP